MSERQRKRQRRRLERMLVADFERAGRESPFEHAVWSSALRSGSDVAAVAAQVIPVVSCAVMTSSLWDALAGWPHSYDAHEPLE